MGSIKDAHFVSYWHVMLAIQYWGRDLWNAWIQSYFTNSESEDYFPNIVVKLQASFLFNLARQASTLIYAFSVRQEGSCVADNLCTE